MAERSCGDRLYYGMDAFQDIFDCEKPAGHEGDHGCADVDVFDGRRWSASWEQAPPKPSTEDGQAVEVGS